MTHFISRAERILSSKYSKVSLWDLVLPKKNLGVGMKVKRAGWSQPECYWEITVAQLTQPGGRLRLRGNKYWNGRLVEEDGFIHCSAKQKWRLVEPEKVVPRLAKHMKDAMATKELREAQQASREVED
mmetsp:Transcript_10729/g.40316  ORF Transcript_10729/g.40316 Transcript_10729/m.40316 type:complete len:128 (-) Transcript_10729:206-589(-)